jgi:hypothetical protein
VTSNNVLDEVSFALETGKFIIPVLLKDCVIPFRLRRFQRIDFNNDDYQTGVNHLIEILNPIIEADKEVENENAALKIDPFEMPPGNEAIKLPPSSDIISADYQTKNGILTLSGVYITPGKKIIKATIKGKPAPDGRYKLVFMWYVTIKNGVVI